MNATGFTQEQTNKLSSSNGFDNAEQKSELRDHSLVKQPSLLVKASDNFAIVENEIAVGKVRVMKPKMFEIKKQAILPTIYSLGEVRRPVAGGGKRIIFSIRHR
jgi:hypothetical protein